MKFFFNDIDILELAREYDIKGNGTKSNPIIFDVIDFTDLPPLTRIKNSKISIQFESCIFNFLRIEKSENIEFKNSEIKHLTMNRCLNLKIENSEFISGLRLEGCTNLEILNSNINLLRLFGCFENLFKNCIVSTTLNIFSRGNFFENTQFIIADMDNVIKGGAKGYPYPIFLIGLLFVVIMLFIFIERYLTENLFYVILITVLICILVSIIFYVIIQNVQTFRKSKIYPPNRVS